MFRSRARIAALAFGGAFLIGAVAMLVTAGPGPALPLAFWGGVIMVAVALERWRYKPLLTLPGPGFEATPERFIDPASGRPVQVFVDRKSGERRYVQS